MGNINVKTFKGLDLRRKHISRDPSASTDMVNVKLNAQNDLIKTHGYESLIAHGAIVPTGIIEYNDEIIIPHQIGLKRYYNGLMKDIPAGGDVAGFFGSISDCQYNDILYMASSENRGIIKYDGGSYYKAGLPKTAINESGLVAGDKYIRLYIKYTDLQLNEHYSEYWQSSTKHDPTSGSFSVLIAYLKTGGYYNRYATSTDTKTVTGVDPVVNIDLANSNFEEGLKILVKDITNSNKLEVVTVENINGTAITFNIPSGVEFNVVNGESVETGRYEVEMWISDSYGYGYTDRISTNLKLGGLGNSTFNIKTNVTVTIGAGSGTSDGIIPSYMADVYDDTVIKGTPPNAKYIAIYNNQMVAMNVVPEDGINISSNKNRFYWSDLGFGSSVETFGPLSYRVIGNTGEGEITGGFSGTNSFLIFKENAPYSVEGNFQTENINIRRGNHNGIGCLSNNSIIGLDRGCVFVSNRGVYYYAGVNVQEISDPIEPLFTEDYFGELDLYNAESVIITKNEEFYIKIPKVSGGSIFLIYQYYHKQWFIIDNIPNTNGMEVINNKIYALDQNINVMSDTVYPDNSFYKTAWIDAGEPSLRKKFTEVIPMSLYGDSFSLDISTEEDWKELESKNGTVELSSESMLSTQNLNNNFCKSIRIKLSNSDSTENMRITGFTIKVAITQTEGRVR